MKGQRILTIGAMFLAMVSPEQAGEDSNLSMCLRPITPIGGPSPDKRGPLTG